MQLDKEKYLLAYITTATLLSCQVKARRMPELHADMNSLKHNIKLYAYQYIWKQPTLCRNGQLLSQNIKVCKQGELIIEECGARSLISVKEYIGQLVLQTF